MAMFIQHFTEIKIILKELGAALIFPILRNLWYIWRNTEELQK